MTVEIIGRACIAPGANSPEELFQLLRDQRCTVSEIPDDRWDKSRYWHPEVGVAGKTYTFAAGVVDGVLDFDPAVFGMSPREAESLDPQQRITLKLAWRALEDANLNPTDLRRERVGVYVGASSLEYGNLIAGDPAAASPYFMTGNTLSVISNRVSHVLGVQGPSLTVDTACSSGLVALDLAVKALAQGDIETAIVGSVNVLAHPLSFVGFAQARMLSPLGLCRAYDSQAEGYVRAEGGAVFILRRTDRVVAERDRSHARILATGVNSAGRTTFISLPSGEAQAALLRSIYEGGQLDVSRLAFIEGHGTGTRVGDPAEIWSIGTEIGQKRRAPIPVGSIKSNIGHTEPASGLLGLMKATLALENNYLPASLHFETPNDQIDFQGLNVTVAAEPVELLRSRKPRLAGVNSFGFGGTNAHVVICDPERLPQAVPAERRSDRLFLASAQSASSLRLLLKSYRDAIASVPKSKAPDVIAAISSNRSHLKHRFATHSDDREVVLGEIDAFLAKGELTQSETGDALKDQAPTAFVFSGNGSQWAGMGVDAFRQSEDFRTRFKVVDALFRSNSELSLTSLLFDPDLETKLMDTRIAQPLLFAVQASLADSLIQDGLRPHATYGHSIGEVAAAYVAGAISLVDAVTIVSKRSTHQHKVAGAGKMIAISIGAEDAASLARSAGLPDVVVAASNAHNAVTLSGPVDQILAFQQVAAEKRIPAQVLDIDYPFHHPLIDVAKRDFLRDLSELGARSSRIPFISTVTGDVLNGEVLDPSYWWRNIREPVRFDAATAAAIRLGCSVFIEFGPRPILSSYIRDGLRHHEHAGTVIPTLQRKAVPAPIDPVRRIFAKAVASGACFDRGKACGERNASLDLPALPFEDKELRSLRTSEAVDLYGNGRREPRSLAGWRVDPTGTAWRNHIDAHLYPDLAEHVVEGRSILPGSGFLEIVLAAARDYSDGDGFELANLEILHPMELSTGRILEVSTVISAETGRIEVKSRERLKDDEWILHAVARIRTSVVPLDAQLETLRPAGRPLGSAYVYGTAKRFGLAYGPKFQLVEQVTSLDEKTIDVRLNAPASPSNPFVSYALNPISTDATFHGLVAMFERFSNQAGGAPYVPVRFGLVQLHQAGAIVRRAVIHIERISVHSLKARIRLLDALGQPVATLSDCRFRRTHLKGYKSLESQTYHYETVASDISLHAPLARTRPQAGEPAVTPTAGPDEASMLLDAAAYRAAYDIVRHRSPEGSISLTSVRTGNLAADSYLVTLLRRLEDSGLATFAETGWTIVETCPLPTFEEIISQFMEDAPQRSGEAMLLIEAYQAAVGQLAVPHSGDPSESAESKPDPVSLSPSLARARREEGLIASLVEALRDLPPGTAPHVMELCAVSKQMTARLADLIATRSGRLTVVESNNRLRNGLDLSFENRPDINIVGAIEDKAPPADLIVSASENLLPLLESEGDAREYARSTLARGGRLLVSAEAAGPFGDVVSINRPLWYARTVDPEFPIGKLGTSSDWRRLGDDLNAADFRIADSSGDNRAAISVILTGDARADRVEAAPASKAIVFSAQRLNEAEAGELYLNASVNGDEERDRETAARLVDQAPERAIIFLPEPVGTGNASESLLTNIASLSGIIKELAAQGERRAYRPKFAVLLPQGSAPNVERSADAATDRARNAGLWAFLRVARNEYPGIDLHTVDFIGTTETSGRDDLATARILMERESASREWLVDRDARQVREIRLTPGQTPLNGRNTRSFAAASLKQAAISQISSLEWVAADLIKPAAGEVAIEVAATALNFRDVMWAIGLLPEEALEDGFAGVSIGMECSGRIVDVGEGVEGLSIGDRVTAIASNAFATHVVAPAAGVERLPDDVPLIAGATVPVAFLTAYYALVELGRLSEGETVLIHGGAGGVGLAALQVAKARGATTIATAGTEGKRRLLTLLGATHVLDSRSLDFVPRVMELTGQQGVDVVLNSLFGEAMERGISLLKPFGRFLELGKRDFFADSKIGLRPFRRNISYFGIDADQLLKSQPKLTSRLFSELTALVSSGDLTPIPYRAFMAGEVRDAFRLMQGSGHIGKIVVTPPKPGVDLVKIPPRPLAFDPHGVHLVVGGIGGFGLAAANWLVENGTRKLALSSRRGIADDETMAAMSRWKQLGVDVTVHACDVTDEGAVQALLANLRAIGPLRSVIHAAMVLDDALLVNLDRGRNQPVIDTKAKGAAILDRLTRVDRLDHFILFSSATTAVGNPGQANYVAANGFLEGLAISRRLEGLPALAPGFGAISDVGYLSGKDAAKAALAKRIGKHSLDSREALDLLAEYIRLDPGTPEAAVVSIAEINWRAAKSLPASGNALFAVVNRALRHQTAGLAEDDFDLAGLIAGKSAQDGERLVFEFVAREIAATLRVPVSEITLTKVVREIGIDSLMAMELGMNFQQKTGFDLPLSNITDTTTVGEIAHKLYARVANAEIEAPAPAAADQGIINRLAERHMGESTHLAVNQ